MEKAIGKQKLKDIQHYNLGCMCSILRVAVGWRGNLINMKVLQSQEIIFREVMLWFQLFTSVRTDI
jgi:hypothetical protein